MITDRLPHCILLMALLFDLIIGEVPNRIHPVVWMGNYINFFWKRRIKKSRKTIFLSGALILISGIFIFFSISRYLSGLLPFAFSICLSVYMLTTVFSMKALIKAAVDIRKALEKSDLPEARKLTAWHLVSRDTTSLSSEEIVSAVIESVAENITDSFTSPLLFYSMGGIPFAWAYRFTNTSDSMIAYRKGDFEWGGKMTAWIDDIFNWLPSRISGYILCCSAFLHRENWKNSYTVMIEKHGETTSPNAGWTMAAMAGALNIKLEKKGEYSLDGGSELRNFELIDRALKLVITAMFLIIIFCFLILEVFYWLNI